MNWHGSCYACTCTTSPHHNQFQFARTVLPPVAARYGRRGAGLLLPRLSASTIDYHEHMSPGTERGARSFGMCRATPVRVTYDRGQGFPHRLGAGFGRRPFALSQYSRIGRANARLGSNLSLCDRTLQSIRQGRPSHFQNSVSCGPTQPRETEHEVPEIRAFGTPDDC